MKQNSILQNKEGKRAALVLSAVLLMVGILAINENWNQQNRPQYAMNFNPSKIGQLNRAIASAQPQHLFSEVQSEHHLASTLNRVDSVGSGRKPATSSTGARDLDQLRYGVLAGKYRLEQGRGPASPGKIKEIEYIDSNTAGDQPVYFSRSQFLAEYKNLFVVNFQRSEIEAKTPQKEIHKLFDDKGKAVGRAAFELDDRGHILSLKIEETSL